MKQGESKHWVNPFKYNENARALAIIHFKMMMKHVSWLQNVTVS